MSLVVALKVLPHGQGLEHPRRATAGAAGVDLCAALPEGSRLVIEPGGRDLVPTGLCLALPVGFEAQVRPRSGLALRFGVTVLNSPGTIDSDYRGEIGVILVNHGAEPFEILRGDRIAQMVVTPVATCEFSPVDELDESSRGAQGFGSTGRRQEEGRE